ncbi:acyl-CoA dehydrogenase family protein [Sphingosinicella microcystinivorans]|uniref:Medium-chain specific acyl-CoA dehydrogenase, mitochondrial n=1 Tax=Sphingosinicella microcystinivorans TaxID=335406 RepID=A0AAD1DAR6_SPHMI|nr:acyl-CoA dehydrogenase family protein [Sphingosinicella microcystinivorans]RKS86328.1 acyl-CoA dehydrogenase [Sphingosinicella microcystinivorans]BBE35626.1 acyl-CoA dehydrogenase [Sphingosinicella microcystinivorans]
MSEAVTDQHWALWDWPFFEPRHHELAKAVTAWAQAEHHKAEIADFSEKCRAIVASLGAADFLKYLIPDEGAPFDVRSLCLIREALTYEEALFDAMFTMQGIGTLAIQNYGTPEQKQRYLPRCRSGEAVAAFALTEPDGGSDVAATTTTAERVAGGWVLNGAKTLISNAGFADHYLVIARTGEAPGSRGLSVFLVDADTPGLECSDPIEFIAEHPAASMTFTDCRIPADALIGEAGQGFKVAMGAFDIFRPSVGAAGVGLARRAMGEALKRARARELFGKKMGELQGVQMGLADMASDIDTAALTVYRAAWVHDVRGDATPYHACMAKLVASEAAGRVVDRAVQLCGGAGVTRGNLVEKLYREARPMRIYEGASEVQKLVVGRHLIAGKMRG